MTATVDDGLLEELADDYPTPGDVCMRTIRGWKAFPHLQLVNEALTDTLTTPNSGLVVELPIRHGKSMLGTVGGAAWSLVRFPDEPVMLGCHTDGLARRFGRSIRRIVRQVGPEFGVRVSSDSHSSSEFDLVGHEGAGFRGVGVGSTPTGVGAKRLFVDDPVKNAKQLRTLEQRDDLWEWFTDTLFGRLHAGGSMVVIMSRWHEDDIVGRIFDPAYGVALNWRRITLPAIAGKGDELGRAPGEALCPGLGYDLDALAIRRNTSSARIWAANWQQVPQTPEGRMFQPSAWGHIDALPAGSQMVRWWDNAATKGGSGAFTAGVLLARTAHPRFPWVVVDVYRKRVGPAERRDDQRATAIADQAAWSRVSATGAVTQGAEQEPGSGGVDQRDLFTDDVMEGLPAVAEGTSGVGKEVRAETWAQQQGAGRVAILRVLGADGVYRFPEWAAAYIAEHTAFGPGGMGSTKDMVDATAHGFNYLALRAPKGIGSTGIASSGGRRLRTGGVRG